MVWRTRNNYQLGPDLTVNTSPKKTYGIVNDADNHVYDAYIPLVVKTANGYQLADIPNGVSGIQESSTKLKRFAIGLNPFTNFTSPVVLVGGISNQANLTKADIILNNNDVHFVVKRLMQRCKILNIV